MTREFFNHQFAALVSAYQIAQKLTGATQEVYWDSLQDVPEDKFVAGVKWCLTECKFFPTIAELGGASLPPITDYRAPLPPIDHERPTINWREQIRRNKQEEKKISDRQRLRIEKP